ncbi:MAG: hypothetical protein Q7T33_15830, partial [Dehalococcoidia bacterium]|nr:hypothetical protein [Dehalococcoidia bacterium]
MSFPSNGSYFIFFTLKLTDDAGDCATGSTQHISIGATTGDVKSAGNKTVPFPADDIIRLPDITVIKNIDRDGNGSFESTAAAGEYCFRLDGGTCVATNGSGQVVFTNVTPDGAHTITETQLDFTQGTYAFVSGSGTSCTFSGSTATATVAAGSTATNATCTFNNRLDTGTITIIKDAVPNDAQDFSFSSTCFAAFSLDDDTDITLSNTKTASHAPGSCTVIEDTPAAGWNLTNLVCTDPTSNSTVNIGTRTATIALAAGESVSCTFTNTRDGTITIIKDAVPNDGQDFSFSGTCFTAFSLDDDTDGTLSNTKSAGHAPATCTVIEDAPAAGWALTNLVCTDPTSNSTVNIGTRTATIALAAGESVSCTFTNTRDGTITIIKDAVPN